MDNEFNIATGIFKGHNDSQGIMICGYEWGEDDTNEADEDQVFNKDIPVTFSNKVPCYGEKALNWRYDKKIIKWFELWGHPLSRIDSGGNFEKCILQTNWCNSQNKKMNGDYWKKLLAEEQINNFVFHVNSFKPRLIIFFGSQMIHILQNEKVLNPFRNVMGAIVSDKKVYTKPFNGKKFRVGFQEFEKCKVVCLPHPSGSRGLCDEYIEMFSPEMGGLLREVKTLKGIC